MHWGYEASKADGDLHFLSMGQLGTKRTKLNKIKDKEVIVSELKTRQAFYINESKITFFLKTKDSPLFVVYRIAQLPRPHIYENLSHICHNCNCSQMTNNNIKRAGYKIKFI